MEGNVDELCPLMRVKFIRFDKKFMVMCYWVNWLEPMKVVNLQLHFHLFGCSPRLLTFIRNQGL